MHFRAIIFLIVNVSYCHANNAIIFPEADSSGNTLSCHKPGKCNGENFLIEIVTDINECILLCHQSINGKWSTYNPDNNFCWLFKTCPEINTKSCQNCATSQRECDILCKYYNKISMPATKVKYMALVPP